MLFGNSPAEVIQTKNYIESQYLESKRETQEIIHQGRALIL